VFAIEVITIVPILYIIVLAVRRSEENPPAWLDWASRVAAVIGILLSFWWLGGLTHLSQLFEFGSLVGVVAGTYLLGRGKLSGYIWFLLMNASCGFLMLIQGYYIMATQQLLSLAFVLDAYHIRKKRS